MFISSIKFALASLWSNKGRTALTVLGMVIGIASVIIVFSAGHGIERLVVGQVESFGTDIIQTEVKLPTNRKVGNASGAGAVEMAQGVQVTTLTLDDMEAVKRLPNIKDAYAAVIDQEKVAHGSAAKTALIFGVSASYEDIDQSEVRDGRFFTAEEDRSQALVAVLGSKVKDSLFGDSDPIDRMISVRKTKFRVIGVMEERSAVMGMDFNDFVYVPVRTLQKRLMGIDHLQYFLSEVNDNAKAEETAAEIRRLLRERHGITVEAEDDYHKDDFRVATMKEMMDILGTVTGALTWLLLGIVAISLTVGGVGIMNIMYVVVTERTAEIGLRKAVGARYSDIMAQFLVESVLVTLMGGAAGIAIGVLASFGIAYGASSFGLDWEFAVPLRAFITALGFSVFFGVAFGLFPARQAARLEPVAAMRAE